MGESLKSVTASRPRPTNGARSRRRTARRAFPSTAARPPRAGAASAWTTNSASGCCAIRKSAPGAWPVVPAPAATLTSATLTTATPAAAASGTTVTATFPRKRSTELLSGGQSSVWRRIHKRDAAGGRRNHFDSRVAQYHTIECSPPTSRGRDRHVLSAARCANSTRNKTAHPRAAACPAPGYGPPPFPRA